jgi:phage tail-like protein
MPQFSVNATRFDPYKVFFFRVKFGNGPYVAGVTKVSPLKRTTDPVLHRNGGDPSQDRKTPGKTKYDAVTLERGLTHDRDFEDWANLIHSVKDPLHLAGFRRDVTIDVFNEADQKAFSYILHRCWPSEFQAVPALDANASAVAIETLKLEIESWERDLSVTEPKEPA